MQLAPHIATEIGPCAGLTDREAVLHHFKDNAKQAELAVKDKYLGADRKILRGPAPWLPDRARATGLRSGRARNDGRPGGVWGWTVEPHRSTSTPAAS